MLFFLDPTPKQINVFGPDHYNIFGPDRLFKPMAAHPPRILNVIFGITSDGSKL